MSTVLIVIDNNALERYSHYYFEQHPKARLAPIKHPYHESINTWMIMKRPAMNSLKQKWKEFIKWLVSDISTGNIERCVVTQRVYFPTNRRHDVDNSVPKFILDGLVESGLIVDDDSRHIVRLILECYVDHDNPRTEIEITTC